MYKRKIKLIKSNSFFLFGARGTGKSTLLSQYFDESEAVSLNLLDPNIARELSAYPERLQQKLAPFENKKPWVVIDEVQKIPQLLDLVHKLIYEKKFHFALTGSSARKLKRGGANMLAGRAFLFKLFPLSISELGENFDLDTLLKYGSLPQCVNYESKLDKERYLKSYVETYVKEEILVEQIVRNLPPFRRFLEAAAQCNTETINYSNIAKDINSDPKIVKNYYEILEDTLLGFTLPSHHKSVRKRQRRAPKFYFFDNGVVRALSGLEPALISPKSYEYGKYFESFFIQEVHRQLSYSERNFRLSHLRIDNSQEIDLIVEFSGKPAFLVEIKSSKHVDERTARTLNQLGHEFPQAQKIVASQDPEPKRFQDVDALHWLEAIRKITC